MFWNFTKPEVHSGQQTPLHPTTAPSIMQ